MILFFRQRSEKKRREEDIEIIHQRAEALKNDFDIVLSLIDEKTDLLQSMSNPREVLKNKVDSCRQMIEQLIS